MIQVHLRHIPENDSLHLEGDVDAADLELEAAGFKAMGPLSYILDIGVSGSGLFATGSLSLPVRTTCVSCVELFDYEIQINDFAMHQELSGSELVDLTPEIREDIHLLLPMHPRCDLGGNTCPTRFPQRPVPSSEISETRPVWAILDNIKH